MSALIALLLVAAAVWLWTDSLMARERALRVCGRACRELNVQLLDQTVALSRLGLGRTPSGRFRIRRVFDFEYSTDGADRKEGRTILLGDRVESIQIERPEGVVILNPGGHGARRNEPQGKTDP